MDILPVRAMFLPALVAALLLVQADPAPPQSAELEALLSQARAECPFPGTFGEEREFEEAPTLYGDPRAQRMQFAQWLLLRKPEHEPGTGYFYSNAGVAVAAAAAERAANRAWEDLMRTRVF
jgi:CubicO group peptidase (beta-lactamase class C family)